MSYTCRVYSNSGFNSVNIPDSPALLDTVSYVDYPLLEIYQNQNLDHIRIKVASYDAIKNADYCRIGDDWYYFVDGITMVTGDTAILELIPDFLTSIGGVSQLEILDGITNRVHVDSDNYGEWCESDPLMAPAEPLEEKGFLLQGAHSSQNDDYDVVIKSTLDLEAMGSNTLARTYTSTSGETVTVPSTEINQDDTVYEIYEFDPQSSGNIQLSRESRTQLFNADDQSVLEGVQIVNDLGINGAISAQVAIPKDAISITFKSGSTGSIEKVVGANEVQGTDANLNYEYSNAKNKKIDYSEYTPYGIISASGDGKQYMPAEIYEGNTTYPRYRKVCDPRTDGKPYFRYYSLNNNATMEAFFRNAVAGIPWKQIPLVYEGAPGKTLTQLSHSMSMENMNLNYEWNKQDEQTRLDRKASIGGFVQASQSASSITSKLGLAEKAGGLLGGFLNDIYDVTSGIENATIGTSRQLDRINQAYQLNKQHEMWGMITNTQVYTPVVQFPFSADLYCDMYHNPCYFYRYRYSAHDIARIDKLLTMYGYRVTKPLEKSDFTNRQKFNYVESSISVGGSHPRWVSNGIALQLANGVRVWHVLPDKQYYTNNPIVV